MDHQGILTPEVRIWAMIWAPHGEISPANPSCTLRAPTTRTRSMVPAGSGETLREGLAGGWQQWFGSSQESSVAEFTPFGGFLKWG